ncbi:hypothetical protein [Gimesia maris]|uniref:hypothetical protein n=1 Tax=Gimesia maris TaxID=122 RepID=UPI003A8D3BCB
MSKYLAVSIPPERSYHTESTEKARKKLVKEIETHHENVQMLKEAQDKIKNSNIEDLSAEEIFDGAANGRFLHGLYKRTLQLHDMVDEFSKLHNKDRDAELHLAIAEEVALKKKIRDGLTEIGFVEEELLQAHRGRVDQFALVHPGVIALRQKIQGLRGVESITAGDRSLVRLELEKLVARHTVTA